MVLLHVKKQDESLFFYNTTTEKKVTDVTREIIAIVNDCLKMTFLQSVIQKFQEGSVEVLSNQSKNLPDVEDLLIRANSEMDVFTSKKLVEAGKAIAPENTAEVLLKVTETFKLIFPCDLPTEIKDVLEGLPPKAFTMEDSSLWFAGKEIKRDKPLSEYLGKNEKSKVIIKLHKKNHGPPSRESGLTEEQQSQLMLHAFKRQQELQRLEEDSGSFSECHGQLQQQRSDRYSLRRSLQGISEDVVFVVGPTSTTSIPPQP